MTSDGSKKSDEYPRVPEHGEPLYEYWDKAVSDLATIPKQTFNPGQPERHTIYSLTTLALVNLFWNGNKYGQEGDYPWRINQKRTNGTYEGDKLGDRYIGHNIASIAVDGNGAIIDFEFNHNNIFASSVEHAEARLVRRIFTLNQNYDHWQTQALPCGISESGYSTLLNDVTIYTSLESCAQCSGIMTLGNVGQVVFLQSDPGQYLIGNILYNATHPPNFMRAVSSPAAAAKQIITAKFGAAAKYGAPKPVDADSFGFKFKRELDEGYKTFRSKIMSDREHNYFFLSPEGKKYTYPSITSYLCTDHAMSVVGSASKKLAKMTAGKPEYRPKGKPEALTNAEVLGHARSFLEYAKEQGRRGTPHK